MVAEPTSRPFTLVVCVGCADRRDDTRLEAFRSVVRQCRHGILVSAPCLLGSAFCATRPGVGALVLVQPCAVDRTPSGPGHWIGPVVDGDDVGDVCAWIRQGRWDPADLPQRLQHPLSVVSRASLLN